MVGDRLISRAVGAWTADQRLMGGWLEGSRAVGDDDGHGDYDFHLAVEPDAWQAAWSSRAELMGACGEPVAYVEAGAETTWITSAVLPGDTWVDLTLERADTLSDRGRLDQPAMLFDRAGTEHLLRPADENEIAGLFRAHLEPLAGRFAWYAANRSRLARQGATLSLFQGAHCLLFDFAVPGLLLAAGRQLPRPHGFNERYLDPQDKETILEAARRLPSVTDSVTTLTGRWTEISDVAAAALRAACARWEITWPPDRTSRG